MKNVYKKSLSWLLILTLIFTTIAPASAVWAGTEAQTGDAADVAAVSDVLAADETITTVATGEAGPYANWKVTSDGVLTISGTGYMYGYDPEPNVYAPWNSYKKSIKEVVIKVGITDIGSYSFWDFENLEKITIPASVKTIGRRAFCISGLENITLPNSLERIEEEAFLNSALSNVNIPDSVTFIGKGAFSGCNVPVIYGINNGLKWDITKSTGVMNITGEGAMPNYDVVNNSYVIWHCYEEFIKTVNISEGITSIGAYTFWDCETLEQVNLPSTLTSINKSAFLLCSKLQNVTFPAGLKSIGEYGFGGCSSMTALNLPAGLESVGPYAFADCDSLASVALPDNLASLSRYMFESCDGLKTVKLPKNDDFTVLPSGLFKDCSNLNQITIPDTVTEIHDEAFKGCVSMTNFDLPEGLKGVYNEAFDGCTGLTSIAFPDSVEVMYGLTNCTNLKSVKLSSNLKYVWGFENCSSLTTIEIPASVELIDNHAFEGCSALSKVTLHEGLERINAYAFNGCSALTSIDFPSTLKTIEYQAFKDCTGLKEITLPKSVSFVDDYAFNGASGLEKITIENSACQLGTAFLPEETKAIAGYNRSTAAAYAELYELEFISLGKPSIEEWTVEVQKAVYYYDGMPKEPTVVVKNSGRDTLVPTVDYELTYLNNVNAGTATVLVEGIGDFTGSQTVEFPIQPARYFDGFTVIMDVEEVTYNGKPHTPGFTITGPVELVEGVDYTYSYTDNVKAKPSYQSAYLQIKGMGNYEGCNLSGSFRINKLDLTGLPIELEYTEAPYTGSAVKPKVTIPGYEDLIEGTDYTVVYENNYSAGTATAYAKAIYSGSCEGKTASATFTIKKTNIADLKAKASLSQDVYAYTGDTCSPAVTITGIDGQPLRQNTDYTVKYENNEEVGDATVTITGKGAYEGSFTMNFTIEPKDVSDMDLQLQARSYTYSGSQICPTVYGYDYEMTDRDYTITYKNNFNAGQGEVIFTGKGNYGGRKVLTFTINPKNIKDEYPTVSLTQYTYTGSAIRPKVNGLEDLVQGTDFKITYKDNVNAGLATVTVTGTGNYTGGVSFFVTIKTKNISEETLTLKQSKHTYTGSAVKPAVTIGGLKQGTDYTVSYKNNVNAGTATVTVTGKGNYSGTASKNFTISPKSIGTKATLSYSKTTYSGSSKKPAVTISGLKKDTHYTVSYKNNVNAGKATVTIKGKGNYTGTITKTFTISPKSIGTKATLSYTSTTYSGSAKKPTVTVKGLKKGTHYTVSYSNNKNVGKATVKVKGTGNYTGTITKTFKINPKAVQISNVTAAKKGFTVKWKKQTKQVTGYQICYGTSTNKSKGKTVTVKKNSTVSKKITGLTGGKKYNVWIRTYKNVGSTPYYSAWSKVKTVKTKK